MRVAVLIAIDRCDDDSLIVVAKLYTVANAHFLSVWILHSCSRVVERRTVRLAESVQSVQYSGAFGFIRAIVNRDRRLHLSQGESAPWGCRCTGISPKRRRLCQRCPIASPSCPP